MAKVSLSLSTPLPQQQAFGNLSSIEDDSRSSSVWRLGGCRGSTGTNLLMLLLYSAWETTLRRLKKTSTSELMRNCCAHEHAAHARDTVSASPVDIPSPQGTKAGRQTPAGRSTTSWRHKTSSSRSSSSMHMYAAARAHAHDGVLDINQETGVCGQGMSNVFAAPPIKFFKYFLGYRSVILTQTLTLNPKP